MARSRPLLEALLSGMLSGNGPSGIEFRGVVTERDRQRGNRVGVIDQTVKLGAFRPRPFDSIADDDKAARQDFHVLARAAEFLHAALHVGIKLSTGGNVALCGEYRFGGFRGELPPRLRRAS